MTYPLIPCDRKPIWTAFITHQILSPTWLSRDSPRVVHLADLQRYVFTEEYNPQKTPSGAHELTFISSAGIFFSFFLSFFFFLSLSESLYTVQMLRCGLDAHEFVKNIRELVRKQRARARG